MVDRPTNEREKKRGISFMLMQENNEANECKAYLEALRRNQNFHQLKMSTKKEVPSSYAQQANH